MSSNHPKIEEDSISPESEVSLPQVSSKAHFRLVDALPQIHLITLHETPERESNALKELAKYPFDVKIHRFHRQTPGWKGCISSHLDVFREWITETQDSKDAYLFICEDNIRAAHQYFPYEQYLSLWRFLRRGPGSNRDFGIIWIGGYILRPWQFAESAGNQCPNVSITRHNNHGTVSYMIHRRLVKEILALPEERLYEKHWDIFLSEFTPAQPNYIFDPLMFHHINHLSSSINQQSDWWRRVWFHPWMMNIHETIFFNEMRVKICALTVVILILAWLHRGNSSE